MQRFSIVLAADASLIPAADLTTFGNSILPSSFTPLVGDLVSVSLAGTIKVPLHQVHTTFNLKI